MTNLHISLAKICNVQYEKQTKNNVWQNSLYQKVNELKLDYVGKVGELFLKDICSCTDIPFVYHEDVNTSRKNDTYDMMIYDYNVEIKTARIGKSNTFQHENLRNKECDFYIFVDIAPFEVYLTILPSFDMMQKCCFSGKTPHLRKGASNIFKFDFSLKTIQTYKENNMCMTIHEQTEHPDVASFIRNKLVQNQ
jgi:hypothetical protein